MAADPPDPEDPPPVTADVSLRGAVEMVTLGLAGFVVVIEVLQPLLWGLVLGVPGVVVLPWSTFLLLPAGSISGCSVAFTFVGFSRV